MTGKQVKIVYEQCRAEAREKNAILLRACGGFRVCRRFATNAMPVALFSQTSNDTTAPNRVNHLTRSTQTCSKTIYDEFIERFFFLLKFLIPQ